MRGPGEREIETDRRIVRNNIALLKTRLQKIDQQNETRRKSRSDKIRVALVGYTNVGKSTLMNQLSDSEILAENKLFATLDTTVRKVVLDTVPFLLSDTVGFIRKLPHHLVESFKSTLDEVREADILVHVVDMAHDAWEAHILVVDSILAELGAVGKPTILVFNKIDLLREKLAKDGTVAYGPMVKGIKKQYLGPKAARVVFVSAAQKEHMDELKKALIIEIKQAYKLMYPYRANPY
jgi:GTP-binding protein HflX